MEKSSTGHLIKKYRLEKKWTQKKLGEECGINEANIRKYESGNQNPKIETLHRIASALNIPLTALLDDKAAFELFGSMSEPERFHLSAVKGWIEDNDKKRAELVTLILGTHNYNIEEKDIHWLIVTDHQGFSFLVSRNDFQELVERCDKDIRYNIEKLLSDSREYKK